MDADQIRQREPKRDAFLEQFADCFARKDTRAHWGVIVRGQLSELPAKSIEPIALEAEVTPPTLQEFMRLLKWNEDRMRQRWQQLVVAEHPGPHAIGICDETSAAKKGDKTPGVQKQGATGQNRELPGHRASGLRRGRVPRSARRRTVLAPALGG